MESQNLYGVNMAFTSAGVAAQTGTSTVDSTTTLLAAINGKMVSLSAQTNTVLSFVSPIDGVTPITATPLAASQACLILHCVNAAGAYKNLQGPIAPLNADDTLNGVLGFPNVPDTLTPFAYTKVFAGASSSGFIPGTTFWDATGVVSTVVNIATLPARPLTV